MYKTAVYTRINDDMLKQQKSWTAILLKQHLANVIIFHPFAKLSPRMDCYLTKFGVVCPVNLINCAKFCGNRFKGFDSVRGQISTLPIDLRCCPVNKVLRYTALLVIDFLVFCWTDLYFHGSHGNALPDAEPTVSEQWRKTAVSYRW